MCVGTFEASRRLVNPLSRPLMPPSTTLGVRRSDISRAYLPPAPPPPLPCHRVFGQIATLPLLPCSPTSTNILLSQDFPVRHFWPGSKSLLSPFSLISISIFNKQNAHQHHQSVPPCHFLAGEQVPPAILIPAPLPACWELD